MAASIYLAAILAPAVVMAIPPVGPEPTVPVHPDQIQDLRPQITEAPLLEDAKVDLRKRQAVDYDKTCGFVSGDLSHALTCQSTYVCATNSNLGVAGCCDPKSLSDCYLYTSCVPSSLMSASCTGAYCLQNSAVAKCTLSKFPYCYNRYYDYILTTMTEFGCDSSAYTQSAELTYIGQTAFDISSYLSSIPAFSIPATVTVTRSPSITPDVEGSSSSSLSSSSSSSGSSSKTPIGAIVGGAIGGLAVLGIGGAILLIFLFKKRRDKRNAAAATPMQQQQYQPPPNPHRPPMGFMAQGGQDYKPPPMGPPPPQQQHQQFGGMPPQQQQQQFYAPPPMQGNPDQKPSFGQPSPTSPPPPQSPYSPPHSPPPHSPSPQSPSPQYTPGSFHQPQHPPANVAQIDGTPIHTNAQGQQIHEVP